MLTFLNRNVMQPLMARKSRSRHLEYLGYLEKSQFDSPEAIRARQLAALRSVLKHAFDTVPYYRAAWTKADIHPSDVKRLEDLDAFPILTKNDIRRHERALISNLYEPSKLRLKRTSGSTGVPLNIRIDEPAAQWKAACTLRSDQWSGYRLGQRIAKVWGNPEYRRFGLKGRLRNALFDRALYLDTLNLTDARIAAFANRLRRHKPGLLFGHAHSLYLLARSLRKAKIDDIRPSGIISTAMILHDWQRSVTEAAFDRPVTNRYGCEEVSLIACECEEHHGMHINSDSVYVEPSKEGRSLIVTDLSNRAMPLIRYQNGDVAAGAERRCRCGRGLPLLERVEGREADFVITPAGRLISGISLTENFALHIAGAAQVQIVQESIDRLRLRIVPDDGFGDASRRQIDAMVEEMFGDLVRCEVDLVDAIPQELSGKFRFCISKVARDHLESVFA